MKKTGITAAILTILLTAACGSEVAGITPPVLPYNPVDEGWKVLANYEYAYDTRDEALLAATLDIQFLHHLLEEDWDDYNGDGNIDSTWDYELEMEFEGNLFSNCEVIELSLSGESSYEWLEDPSGESIAYPRAYDMIASDSGFSRSGEYTLVCRPDTNDIWHLTHLIEIE